jgi:mercuric ion binding protein
MFKKIILTTLIAFFAGYAYPEIKTTAIDLSTNMVCRMAERIIEKAVKKVNGVVDIEIDPETKTAVVTYDDSKTSVSEIVRAITKTGYDANGIPGDSEAYEKLPDCCKIK